MSLFAKVFEGYGQTEGTACQTLTLPGETTAGHVGPPIPSIQMKLVDVPDMNYYAANGEGEVSDLNYNHLKKLLVLLIDCVDTASVLA